MLWYSLAKEGQNLPPAAVELSASSEDSEESEESETDKKFLEEEPRKSGKRGLLQVSVYTH